MAPWITAVLIAPVLGPSLQPHSLPCHFVGFITKDAEDVSELLDFGFGRCNEV